MKRVSFWKEIRYNTESFLPRNQKSFNGTLYVNITPKGGGKKFQILPKGDDKHNYLVKPQNATILKKLCFNFFWIEGWLFIFFWCKYNFLYLVIYFMSIPLFLMSFHLILCEDSFFFNFIQFHLV